MESKADAGGLFGVSLETLARRRANPPPFLAELDLLFSRLESSAALANTLDAAMHPRLSRPVEVVSEALDAQGAHASLATALEAAALRDDDAPAVGFAILLRLLRRLPTPAMPCELYEMVLSAGANALPALLRTRLPPAHAALVTALGTMLGNLLLRCDLVARAAASSGSSPSSAPTPAVVAADERAMRALVFALTPALLRADRDALSIPNAQRVAAERATRHLLLYHAERQALRALAGTDRAAVTPASSAAASPASMPPTPPVHGTPPPHTPSPARPRSGALALHSVGVAIMTMFEREFGPGAVEADARPGARKAKGVVEATAFAVEVDADGAGRAGTLPRQGEAQVE